MLEFLEVDVRISDDASAVDTATAIAVRLGAFGPQATVLTATVSTGKEKLFFKLPNNVSPKGYILRSADELPNRINLTLVNGIWETDTIPAGDYEFFLELIKDSVPTRDQPDPKHCLLYTSPSPRD